MDLPKYDTLDNKRKFFANGQRESFIINNRDLLDKWFKDVEDLETESTKSDPTVIIYRGLTEAKYKLLTSSQRIWLSNEMNQWAKKPYLHFISDLVKNAKSNHLIKKVFDLHNYSDSEREFPILSLLQHYGAPTPLMDWTYNSNVAFYFATDGLTKKESPKQDIDDYFSVYRIDRTEYKKTKEFLNIIDFIDGAYPEILSFKDFGSNGDNGGNSIFYISDFERKGESIGAVKPFAKLLIRTTKPLTSVYNQNIIPQEGMFVFNPYSSKPLEDIFNVNLNKPNWNLALRPFDCFNIHKDLGEYLRRKIDVRYKINKAFIYPNLNDEAKRIKEQTINGLV